MPDGRFAAGKAEAPGPAAGGATVLGIDWDGAARWHALNSPASPDPVADAAAQSRYQVKRDHTFGRFRIAHFKEFDVAILVRHIDSPVYAMRLSQ